MPSNSVLIARSKSSGPLSIASLTVNSRRANVLAPTESLQTAVSRNTSHVSLSASNLLVLYSASSGIYIIASCFSATTPPYYCDYSNPSIYKKENVTTILVDKIKYSGAYITTVYSNHSSN